MRAYFFSLFVIVLFENSVQAQTHTIGESFGGGIIFSLSADSIHGLIVETIDQSKSCIWDDAIIAIKDTANHNKQAQKHTDWRLPTIEELQLVYSNLKVSNLCSTNSSFSVCFESDYYWSSSKYIYTNPETGDYEYDYANYFKFSDGTIDWTAMGNSVAVRAIREF
jgi:hypothetical protein